MAREYFQNQRVSTRLCTSGLVTPTCFGHVYLRDKTFMLLTSILYVSWFNQSDWALKKGINSVSNKNGMCTERRGRAHDTVCWCLEVQTQNRTESNTHKHKSTVRTGVIQVHTRDQSVLPKRGLQTTALGKQLRWAKLCKSPRPTAFEKILHETSGVCTRSMLHFYLFMSCAYHIHSVLERYSGIQKVRDLSRTLARLEGGASTAIAKAVLPRHNGSIDRLPCSCMSWCKHLNFHSRALSSSPPETPARPQLTQRVQHIQEKMISPNTVSLL